MKKLLRVTMLSGGVGGAKLVKGMSKILVKNQLTVVGNTGDDFEIFGLYISPDLDIVMYTLADIVDYEKGWGILNDSYNCLVSLKKYYRRENWFNLGDRDLSTHIYRTELLKKGLTLSKVTDRLCASLGVNYLKLKPMSDDRVQTLIRISRNKIIPFQEYFVKRKCIDPVLDVIYQGSDKAKPAEGVLESIVESDLVIICPSNPVASIGPILSIKGIRQAILKAKCPRIVVSPIVSGAPLKGPTDKFMSGLGLDVSAFGVAEYYRGIADHFILDESDKNLASKIESLGYDVYVTNIVMNSLEDKIRLSKFILSASGMEG